MSRRDTIIIAVLINAGLLIILFASALKSDKEQQEPLAVNSPKPAYVEPVLKKDTPMGGGDEVDHALHQFAMPSQTSAPAPYMPQIQPQPSGFAEDVKMLPSPEMPPVAPVAIMPSALTEERGASEFTEIKVKKGDVLEKIAKQYHTTVSEITALNKLPSVHLRIGQTLKIPHKKAAGVAVSAPAASTAAAAKYYIVKNGDNPWTIAVKNHMKVEDLLKLNDLDQEKARRLKPGDKLKIQ